MAIIIEDDDVGVETIEDLPAFSYSYCHYKATQKDLIIMVEMT